ncbi:hypothetical protein [Bartonella acomydis]|uniref:hypothetical protein n=1 Tax=Bartonella acomydis TaxID=686234 RepID=UPI0031E8EDDE
MIGNLPLFDDGFALKNGILVVAYETSAFLPGKNCCKFVLALSCIRTLMYKDLKFLKKGYLWDIESRCMVFENGQGKLLALVKDLLLYRGILPWKRDRTFLGQ